MEETQREKENERKKWKSKTKHEHIIKGCLKGKKNNRQMAKGKTKMMVWKQRNKETGKVGEKEEI